MREGFNHDGSLTKQMQGNESGGKRVIRMSDISEGMRTGEGSKGR